jgi:hypothetical protein
MLNAANLSVIRPTLVSHYVPYKCDEITQILVVLDA